MGIITFFHKSTISALIQYHPADPIPSVFFDIYSQAVP